MEEQGELFDFMNYPERWAFTTTRIGGVLTTKGVGMYAASCKTMYQVEFEFRKDGWVRTLFCDFEDGENVQVPGEIEVDLYREFAYHKATYLAAKKKKRELQGEFTRSVRTMR